MRSGLNFGKVMIERGNAGAEIWFPDLSLMNV
jgi:hypothetical protein